MPFDFPIQALRFLRSNDIFNDGEHYVSITRMCQEEFIPSMNHVVIAEMLYIKKKKEESVFNKSRGTDKNLSFDRILMCRCLNSPSGLNCFAILLGQQRNNKFFHRHLEGR